MENAIANAVAPLKIASINAALEAILKMIFEVEKKLEIAGWDMDLAFPMPKARNESRASFSEKKAERDFAFGLVKVLTTSRRHGDPLMVEICNTSVSKTVDRALEDAAAQYEAYVVKMINKIGSCESAEMAYNNGLWFDSDLLVVKSGTKEVWNTRCIINRSCLGKLFNQFPTRKRK
jgi:hypothetical protein